VHAQSKGEYGRPREWRVLPAKAGQTMRVTLKSSNVSNNFNVLPPGCKDVAIFVVEGHVFVAARAGTSPPWLSMTRRTTHLARSPTRVERPLSLPSTTGVEHVVGQLGVGSGRRSGQAQQLFRCLHSRLKGQGRRNWPGMRRPW
jgi:hypothetical protein